MKWRREAACKDMDINMFFPDGFKNAAKAKEVCYGCPVRRECLAYALSTYTQEGVWGGFYSTEIKKKGRRYLDGTDECVNRRKSQVLRVAPYWREVPIRHDYH